MVAAGQTLPKTPVELDQQTRLLRAKLIFEEALETIQYGLGVDMYLVNVKPCEGPARLPSYDRKAGFTQYTFHTNRPMDIAAAVDGCCDVSVVTIGTLSAMGVSDEPVLKEVDQNNLAKFGPGGHKAADGKWEKPVDHKPPNIIARLIEQGWEPKEG